MALIDELRADQDPRIQCRFCAWLLGRTPEERAEWRVVTVDRSFTHSSLFRAARKRGYLSSFHALDAHRKGQHEGPA